MRNTIDSCVDIGVAEGHVQRQGVMVVGVCVRLSNNFWFVCASPGITPGDLTCLTGLPADCSGGIAAGKWRRYWGWEYLGSGGVA